MNSCNHALAPVGVCSAHWLRALRQLLWCYAVHLWCQNGGEISFAPPRMTLQPPLSAETAQSSFSDAREMLAVGAGLISAAQAGQIVVAERGQ